MPIVKKHIKTISTNAPKILCFSKNNTFYSSFLFFIEFSYFDFDSLEAAIENRKNAPSRCPFFLQIQLDKNKEPVLDKLTLQILIEKL